MKFGPLRRSAEEIRRSCMSNAVWTGPVNSEEVIELCDVVISLQGTPESTSLRESLGRPDPGACERCGGTGNEPDCSEPENDCGEDEYRRQADYYYCEAVKAHGTIVQLRADKAKYREAVECMKDEARDKQIEHTKGGGHSSAGYYRGRANGMELLLAAFVRIDTGSLENGPPPGWRSAVGCAPAQTDELPEDGIRRTRDGKPGSGPQHKELKETLLSVGVESSLVGAIAGYLIYRGWAKRR